MLVRVYRDIAGPHGAPELKLCKVIDQNTHSRLEKRDQQEPSYIYSVNKWKKLATSLQTLKIYLLQVKCLLDA